MVSFPLKQLGFGGHRESSGDFVGATSQGSLVPVRVNSLGYLVRDLWTYFIFGGNSGWIVHCTRAEVFAEGSSNQIMMDINIIGPGIFLPGVRKSTGSPGKLCEGNSGCAFWMGAFLGGVF